MGAGRFRLLRLVLIGLGAALGLAFIAAWATSGQGNPMDFHAYWAADPIHPYTHPGAGAVDAFQYTPAAALVAPLLRLIPFALAIVIWRVCQVGAILTTVGPWAVVVLLTFPVASELNLGNINLIIGLAIVAGFRWPAVWAFVLLTKPTCGLGLLWFVVRRDWRSLRIALGVTVILAAASFVVVPGAWFEYVGYLLGNPAPAPQGFPALWVRLPFAVVVAIVSAYKNWRAGAVVAAWLALPVWWYVSPSLLVGVLAYTWPSPLTEKRRLETPPGDVKADSSRGRASIRAVRSFRMKSHAENP